MTSDRRIPIDGFAWRPDDLLERLRSPELPGEEFWRSMSYALFVMRDDEEYLAELNAVKAERTATSFPPQTATTPQNEIREAPPRILQQQRTYKIYHSNLDERQIVTALLQTDKLSLGPKQFALAVREFFRSIGWLVNEIDTQFVGWMKDRQIINAAANDLQHVNRTENMETLKENLRDTFQFKNAAGLWEDRGDFYKRKDSQKINSGRPRMQ